MKQAIFDQMTQRVIERIFDDGASARAAVRDLVDVWPDVEILEITLALAGAADAIDNWFTAGSPSRHQSAQAYKMAALVSLDYYAMQSLGLPCKVASDLPLYWSKYDGYFLAG